MHERLTIVGVNEVCNPEDPQFPGQWSPACVNCGHGFSANRKTKHHKL